ncbi:hypothetical protein GCM10022378_00490 [Salinicoccus jeotgali]|uniref:HTH cro/C1-type domain-containing protein n=1 Tax=Salinicoccus jeotgali TaxID=381634 RepID=A0ABP7E330_9STAP
MEYYTRFKEMRQQKGLTHLEAAEGICGKTTIYRFERGDAALSAPILHRLCRRLGISMQDLFIDEASEYALIDHYLDMMREYVYFRHADLLKVTLEDAQETINIRSEFDLQYRNYKRLFRTYTAIMLRNEGRLEESEHILTTLIDETKATNMLELEIINTLGDLYIITDRSEDALMLYHKHRNRILESRHMNEMDRYMIIQLYYGYAISLYNNFFYAEAVDICYKLLIRIEENNSLYYQGKANHLMTLIHVALNEPKSARHYLAKAEAAFFLENLQNKMAEHIEIAKNAIEALE